VLAGRFSARTIPEGQLRHDYQNLSVLVDSAGGGKTAEVLMALCRPTTEPPADADNAQAAECWAGHPLTRWWAARHGGGCA